MKKAFTLIEVNLAMLIMATGVLVMCGLYSLGFRENRQSVEDVAAASFADTYLGPLVQGLSATNLPWSSWIQLGDTPSSGNARSVAQGVWPSDGWLAYVQRQGNDGNYRIKGSPRSTADGVWGRVKSKIPSPYQGAMPSISGDYHYALVMTRRGTVIQLAFRASRRKEALMSQPLFVSEVRFQGDPNR
ncbi:MAG: hypothetical protein K6G91_06640 [Kiritimatiellae bacterium]|nr:hypothetical protein [Kiritimatiellia bacterium]